MFFFYNAKGEAMVTPASLIAAESDESAFALPMELACQKLGDIPDDAQILGENAPSQMEASDANEDAAPFDASVAAYVGVEDSKAIATQFTSTKGAEYYKRRKIYVWLPIAFPDVPAKGDFDVTRLKQSKYFFH